MASVYKRISMTLGAFLIGLIFTITFGYKTVYSKYMYNGKVKNYYQKDIKVSYQNSDLKNDKSF